MHRLYGLGMTPNPNNDSVGSGASGSPSNNAASVSDAPDLGDPANIGGGTGEAGASSSAQAPKPSVPVRDEKENTEGQTAVGPVEALTLTAAPGEEPAGVSEAPVPGQALTLAAAPGEEPAGVSEAPANILDEILKDETGAALSPETPVGPVEVQKPQPQTLPPSVERTAAENAPAAGESTAADGESVVRPSTRAETRRATLQAKLKAVKARQAATQLAHGARLRSAQKVAETNRKSLCFGRSPVKEPPAWSKLDEHLNRVADGGGGGGGGGIASKLFF